MNMSVYGRSACLTIQRKQDFIKFWPSIPENAPTAPKFPYGIKIKFRHTNAFFSAVHFLNFFTLVIRNK